MDGNFTACDSFSLNKELLCQKRRKSAIQKKKEHSMTSSDLTSIPSGLSDLVLSLGAEDYQKKPLKDKIGQECALSKDTLQNGTTYKQERLII